MLGSLNWHLLSSRGPAAIRGHPLSAHTATKSCRVSPACCDKQNEQGQCAKWQDAVVARVESVHAAEPEKLAGGKEYRHCAGRPNWCLYTACC